MHAVPRKERDQNAKELIERFHLQGLEDKRPATLSGGEQQRVALARIFASSPEVLLLDEPFSSLDTLLKLELIPYIKEIVSSFGGETLMVSHNIDEVIRLCDTVTPIASGLTEPTVKVGDFYETIQKKYESAGMILPQLP